MPLKVVKRFAGNSGELPVNSQSSPLVNRSDFAMMNWRVHDVVSRTRAQIHPRKDAERCIPLNAS